MQTRVITAVHFDRSRRVESVRLQLADEKMSEWIKADTPDGPAVVSREASADEIIKALNEGKTFRVHRWRADESLVPGPRVVRWHSQDGAGTLVSTDPSWPLSNLPQF
jgi:hypothetical protein